MSRTFKRFLSILLTAAMVLSLGIAGWAIDDITIVEPEKPVKETDERVTAGFEGGTELEQEEIDPSTLNVPKLGKIEEEEIPLEEEDPFDPDEIVRVSIVLDALATIPAGYDTQGVGVNRSAISYRDSLKKQQAAVEAAIVSEGVSMNVKWNMTLLVNAISAEVRYGDIETIKAVAGVSDVWLETKYEPQVDEVNTAITTDQMVGATAVWANGYTGAGSKVAIIDTGTNQDHISFDPEALEYALEEDGGDYDLLTWADISALAEAGQLNVTVNQNVYKNTKIPYAYNYVDGGYTTDHDSDTQGEHGSHVSGIAAANRYVKVDGKFVESATSKFAVGVAPDAQILTMKVFGRGGGAYDSDYMVAIEDAIVLGADSVNLSLGSGSPGFTFSNGYQAILDSLVECGTVVSISAGNAYKWGYFAPSGIPYLYLEDVGLHTGGSPGSFVNSLCVAAAENVGTIAAPLIFNDDQLIGFTEITTGNDGSAYGNRPISTIAGTYEYVLVNGPGVTPLTDEDDDNGETAIGTENDAFAVLGSEVLSGKVAICYRGSSSFYVKANAAVAQGAVAVIIINNQAGTINMNLSGYKYRAPVVSILKADGDEIRKNSTAADGYYTGTVEITADAMPIINTEREDATVTVFSSWGVPGSLIMKPEITAPGGDIYSVNGMTDTEYEYMSGTSMAAPHVTGMAALLGQYIRENNLEEVTGQNRRTLINSLLMSTATPMINDGDYVSILQQGSGLGDTFAATQAKSYILMGEDATASWKDGKVKVELGQDAARTGEYTFSFTVNNFSDIDMEYFLATDLFTQWIAGADADGNLFLDDATILLYAGEDFYESYSFPTLIPNLHDVDKDGDTDEDDAQALLDYITGAYEAGQAESPYYEDLDLDAGEMDGEDGISSYDAQLLLEWLEAQGGTDTLLVPAGESVTVTVNLTLDENTMMVLDYYFENGFYVEGFTYVYPLTETDDGEMVGAIHTIPILGYYGSWTDASMFDCVSAIDKAYGSTKISYTGNAVTNYLTVNYGAEESIYMGNPYAVEDEFPADRLAVNADTALVNFKYNLIRNAASVGWMALDDDGGLITNGTFNNNVTGAWYYVNGQQWRDTGTKTMSLNTSAAKLGLKDGDTFTIGLYAVPEYYGMMLHPGENRTAVTAGEIAGLLEDGEIGDGASIDYTFLVDSIAPQITKVEVNDDKTQIAVTAKDDNYLAFIAIVDILGNEVFVGTVPEQSEPGEEVTVTFDISGLGLEGAVAAFAGDYAANEDASLIRLSGSGTVPVVITTKHEVYIPATTLESGRDYIIVSANTAGSVQALESRYGSGYLVVNSAVTVQDGTIGDYTGRYIEVDDVIDGIRWVANPSGNGFSLQCVADGTYIYPQSGNRPAAYNEAPWNYDGNRLTCVDYFTVNFWIAWNSSRNYFWCYTSQPTTNCYLFVRDEYYTEETVEIDPDNASEVVVSPDDLLMMVGDTETLRATVSPLVLSDKSVTWSSLDENVATVDANGVVTAVGAGETEIIATSNLTPTVSGSAHVKVLAPVPIDATIYGQVAFGDDDVEFVSIDLNDMSTVNLSGDEVFSYFYGGAQSGGYIYGNDTDNDFHRYVVEDYSYDGSWHDVWEVIDNPYALIDGASIPNFTFLDYDNVDEETGDPAEVDFLTNVIGVSNAGYLLFYDEGGLDTMTGFSGVASWNMVAITFAGLTMNDGLGLYYYALTANGEIYLLLIEPEIEEGEPTFGLRYMNLGVVEGLTMSDDPTAYSMMYSAGVIDSETEDGVFIADNTVGGIYYVDMMADELVAQFVGKIDGATNLSTLYDNYFDAAGYIGSFEVGGDDSGSLIGSEFLREKSVIFAESEVMHLEKINPYDTEIAGEPVDIEDVEIVSIEDPEDTEIVEIIGGLDSVRSVIRRPDVELDSAELLNPDTYSEDGIVEIGVTTPGLEFPGPEAYYNGFATIEYDPDAMTFVDYEVNPGLQLTSVYVDEENGIINIAYASLEPIGEGIYAVMYFTVPEENTEVTVTTSEANEYLDVDDVTVIPFVVGYSITIEDYTNGGATTSIEADSLYLGEVTFTVDAEIAVAVIVKDGPFPPTKAVDWDEDFYRYTTVDCVDDEDGNHTFTILVEEDTTICLVYKGDVNLNGKVETKDGTMVKRYAVELYDLTDPLERLVADVNGNGKIESKDGTAIAQQVVGSAEIPW